MEGFFAGLLVIAASIVGSVVGIIIKKFTHKANDMLLGYAAGIMLCAAFIGLLPSAFPDAEVSSILLGIAGIAVGAVFISLIDRFAPHSHGEENLLENGKKSNDYSKVMLLVIAIAIHNIPEGLATGISFSNGMTESAVLVAVSMIIQKIPEGLIVAVPLVKAGMSRKKAFGISCIVGLMMLPGLLVGVFLGTLPPALLAFFYAFTFGAIVYVISDEIIPESHKHGFQKPATFSLIAGILTVLLIDMLL